MKKYVILGLCLLLLSVIVPREAAWAAGDTPPAYPAAPPAYPTAQPASPAAQAPSTPDAQIRFEAADYTASAKLTESVKSDSVLFDILILRPAGILACGVGLAASVAALPFTLPTRSEGEVAKTLIDEPFAYTFTRPVGQIDP